MCIEGLRARLTGSARSRAGGSASKALRGLHPGSTLLGALLLFALQVSASDSPILLSGTIEDARSQRVMAPRTDSWQIQVQWMADEGSQVQPGDVLVRFDAANVETRIEQSQASQRQVSQQHVKTIDAIRLRLLDNDINLARAAHRVTVAELDASIPAAFLPALTHERNQLELAKARAALTEVEKQIAADRLALDMAIAEAELDERRLATEMAYLERIRDGLVVNAERAGFVIYGSNRVRRSGGAVERVFPGDTVQAGDNVLQVSGRDALHVRVWIHEVDLLGLEVGQPSSIVFDAHPGVSHSGVIEWLSSQASARPLWGNANWFEATIAFDEIPADISPGMSVRVEPLATAAVRSLAERAQ